MNASIFHLITDEFMRQIDCFYAYQETCLIHGDLTPDNVYYVDGVFYLIDFSDSEFYLSSFDKYTFLKRAFEDFGFPLIKLKNYFLPDEIEKLETHLKSKNDAKHCENHP